MSGDESPQSVDGLFEAVHGVEDRENQCAADFRRCNCVTEVWHCLSCKGMKASSQDFAVLLNRLTRRSRKLSSMVCDFGGNIVAMPKRGRMNRDRMYAVIEKRLGMIAWLSWFVIWTGVAVLIWKAPFPHNEGTIYQIATRQWWLGRGLYIGNYGVDGFLLSAALRADLFALRISGSPHRGTWHGGRWGSGCWPAVFGDSRELFPSNGDRSYLPWQRRGRSCRRWRASETARRIFIWPASCSRRRWNFAGGDGGAPPRGFGAAWPSNRSSSSWCFYRRRFIAR